MPSNGRSAGRRRFLLQVKRMNSATQEKGEAMKLVDAEPFIRDLTAMKSMYDAIALDGMIKALEEAPIIDAAEVLRSQWISVKDKLPEPPEENVR